MENEHQTVFSPHLRASSWLRWCWFTAYTDIVKDKTAPTPPQLPGVCLVPNSRQMSTITSSPLNRRLSAPPSLLSRPRPQHKVLRFLHICFLPSHYPEFFLLLFFLSCFFVCSAFPSVISGSIAALCSFLQALDHSPTQNSWCWLLSLHKAKFKSP